MRCRREPNGIAQALIIAEPFLDGAPSALILGDNIFYGANLPSCCSRVARTEGATVFGYYVQDPERYGVVEFDAQGKVTDLLEKPARPPSNYAITGIYFYDTEASALARSLKPSARGELEITDLNRAYLGRARCGWSGSDAAPPGSTRAPTIRCSTPECSCASSRSGRDSRSPAWRRSPGARFHRCRELLELAKPLAKSGYGEYLVRIVKERAQP